MVKICKKLRWKHFAALVCLLAIFLVPYLVFAEDAKTMLNSAGIKAGYETGAGQNNIGKVVASAINGFLALIGVIFLSYIFYAGYLWMTAGGNEEQINKAKSQLRNGIIGLVIIIGAYAIVNYVLEALIGRGGGGGSGPIGSP